MVILENKVLKVQISETGAELTSVYDKDVDRECLWTADPNVWAKHAPVLFPVVGSCRGKQYRYEGKTYSMPQHGFAKTRVFAAGDVVKDGETLSTVLTLLPDAETDSMYPFAWKLEIFYTLEGKSLKVAWKVTNTSAERPMYFSIGGHPGFLFDGALEDQQFEFNSDENLDRMLLNLEAGLFSRKIRKDYLKNGEPLPVTPHLFDQDAVTFHNFRFTKLSLVNRNTRHGVTMDLTGFPYVGLWAKPGAPYACIEPWYGLADYDDFFGELPEKDGIMALEPGREFNASYELTFC